MHRSNLQIYLARFLPNVSKILSLVLTYFYRLSKGPEISQINIQIIFVFSSLWKRDSFSISDSIYTLSENGKKKLRLIYIPSTEISSSIKICGLWFVNISNSISYRVVSARIFRAISFPRIVVCILSTMSQCLGRRRWSRCGRLHFRIASHLVL